MKIIFICTSNVCRSVIAESLLKEKLKENLEETQIEIYSAGIFAQDGDCPMLNVVEAMQELRNRCKRTQSKKYKKHKIRANGLNIMCNKK